MLMDLGVDNSSPNSGGDAHDEHASTDSAQTDDDQDSHARARQELGSEEPGSPYDDMISSDPKISNPKFGNVVDDTRSNKSRSRSTQGALQSAESRPRVAIPNGHTRFGQISPKVGLPYPRPSKTIKAPLFPPGATSRALGHEVEYLPLKTKRGGSAMAGQLHKRNRRTKTNQARVDPNTWPSDSDSDSSYDGQGRPAAAKDARQRRRQRAPRLSGFKVVGAPQWKLRSGGRTSFVGAHSPSGLLLRGAEDSQIPNSAGVLHDDCVAAAYGSPMLQKLTTPPVTSTEAAVLTVLLTSTAEIGALLESPTAWGLTGDLFSSARLINATVKPYASEQWQLTATFSRAPGVTQLAGDPGLDAEASGSSADSDHSSSSMSSIHHDPSEIESGSRIRGTRRGRWEEEDDKSLLEWRRLGKSWLWIYKQFPDRTEGAIKSRWYVVLAPRQKSQKGRDG